MKERFIQGNEACVLGALAAGAKFFAGYPITPATEMAEFCSNEMPKVGGVFLQMEDEIASIAAVVGASLGGLKSFTATSGPGMSLMQENLGFACMAEVPCVIINVQRYGGSTGVATKPGQGDIMQARWGTHSDHSIIALTPSTVQECFDLTFEAFNLAERFSNPVILLTDALIGHLREKVIIPEKEQLKVVLRTKPSVEPEQYLPYRPNSNKVPHLSAYGDQHILRVTSLMHDEQGYSTADPEVCGALVERLEEKIMDHQQELPPAKYYGGKDAEIVVISFGISARPARQAVDHLNKDHHIDTGMIDLKTIWPFPAQAIKEYCKKASNVFVVEMNRGQVLGEVEKVLKETRINAIQRTDTLPITPDEIVGRIKEVLI